MTQLFKMVDGILVPLSAADIAQMAVDAAVLLEEKNKRSIARFTDMLQKRLDYFAQGRGYDNILSACTYASSTIPKFAAEGQRAVVLRDQTWATAYAILAAVLQEQRPVPTRIQDIEAELPVMEWADGQF